jgi:pimeloyl-ACP methyl ester carboxylesterase
MTTPSGRKNKRRLLLLFSKPARIIKSKQKVGLVPTSREGAANISRPLIFVPGIMASSLAIKKPDGNLDYFWPPPYTFPIPEMIEKMRKGLESDIRTKAEDKVPVHATGLFPYTYYYLISAIEIWGYTRNQNFWIFPYDWRQSNDISGKLLANFINEKIEEGKIDRNEGVDIVNHSMGGFVTRAASLQYGAPIKRAVYIGSPHYGCPLSYFALHPDIGHEEGFSQFLGQSPIENTLNLSLEMSARSNLTSDENNDSAEIATAAITMSLHPRLKEAFRKFPSMYELLPDFYYLKNKPILYEDTTPIYGVDDTYLCNDWKFKDESAISMTRQSMNFKKEKLGEKLPGKKENNIVIYGIEEPTDDTIVFQTRFFMSGSDLQSSSHTPSHEFSLPYDSGQQGDSWVPTLSGMASMSGSPQYPNSKAIQGIHTSLPDYASAIEYIWKSLISTN